MADTWNTGATVSVQPIGSTDTTPHEDFTMCCISRMVFHESKTCESCYFMNKIMFSFHELRVGNGPVNRRERYIMSAVNRVLVS